MARKKDRREGYGKLLEAWDPPKDAGEPIGCLATTFTFKPAFFEEECLSRFLGLETDPAEDGAAYLIEREEKLAQLECATALVDQHHCRGCRSLRWDLLPARVPGGLLHAKITLLRWAQWVRLIVASANLTEDGYRRNQEVFGILDYYPKSEAPLACLRQVLTFLREMERFTPGSDTPALVRWRVLLDGTQRATRGWGLEDAGAGRQAVRIHAVLSGPKRPSVLEQLGQVWPSSSPPYQAKVMSPFFDPPTPENKPAKEIWQVLRKRGAARVAYYVSGQKLPQNAVLLYAPESLRRKKPHGQRDVETDFHLLELENSRPLHAKGIWLMDNRWAMYMIGSSNFTTPGLGLGGSDDSRGNLEANLAYCINGQRERKGLRRMENSFPNGLPVDPDNVRWEWATDPDEETLTALLLLPAAFGTASYDFVNGKGKVTLALLKRPAAGWRLLVEESDELFLTEKLWENQGCPDEIHLAWTGERPPSGFTVEWAGKAGRAWWPVNVTSAHALPPPEELKDLPLSILLSILTSARPLHRVLEEYLRKKMKGSNCQGNDAPEIDPHRRVDTSRFLLQRTRQVSWALSALRERLDRPVATRECLEWRLRGPVGAKALAEALMREAHSKPEEIFLLCELILELARARPNSAPGMLPPQHVRQALAQLACDLRQLLDLEQLENEDPLRNYVQNAFESVVS